MPNLGISFDEIMQEIKRLESVEKAGFTVSDMAATTGRSKAWCREKLQRLIHDGKVRNAGTVPATSIDGKTSQVPIYSATPKAF